MDLPVLLSAKKGQVVVSESAHRISTFTSELQHILSVGSEGASACQFRYPGGIANTEDDRVLIADCYNHRIQVLTMEGQFRALVGAKRNGLLQFEFPVFTMVHPNGKVLVSERDSNRTQVLNQDLAFSHSRTTCGSPREIGHGYFGMVVDSQSVSYATD